MKRMNQTTSIAIAIFACVSFLSGCQKLEGNKVSRAPQIESLNGKSATEILQKKYSRAILSCDLYVQHAAEFTKSNPNDHFSVDLLGAERPVSLELTGTADGVKLEASLTFQEIVPQTLQVEDSSGSRYLIQNSPTVPVKFDFTETNGATNVAKSTMTLTIVEKIASQPLALSRTIAGDEVPFHELVECRLETDIKSQYADQFKTVKLSK